MNALLHMALSPHFAWALILLGLVLVFAIGPAASREHLCLGTGLVYGSGLAVWIYQRIHRTRMTMMMHHHLHILADLERSGIVDPDDFKTWMDRKAKEMTGDHAGS